MARSFYRSNLPILFFLKNCISTFLVGMDWPIERNLKQKIDRAKYYIQQCGQTLHKIRG